MKHLLLVAAFLAAMQPLAAHLNRPNGATILAAILVLAWGWAVIPNTSTERRK